MGQTHPKGVLWVLVTESVVSFHSGNEMLVKVHGVTNDTVLHEEPIRICTSSSSTAHMRAYIPVRDGWPSSAQSLIPDRDDIPQPSPSNPQPDWRTPHQFQIDLGDAQLRQFMEDLCQEVTHRELNVPPRTLHLGCWRTPAGDGDPNVDDQEVTFPRGRGWEPRGQPPQPTAPLN